jgi:hypothetical protein
VATKNQIGADNEKMIAAQKSYEQLNQALTKGTFTDAQGNTV